jgi:ribosome recycling factor
MQKAIDEKKESLDQAIEHLKIEMGKIRTGRANPGLIESLLVDYYGAKTPLKQIATINTPEPRLLTIQPWDKGSLVNIEAAIRESDLGFNPNNDGQLIRISIPQLTEDRRKEFVKLVNQKAEEAKIAVRNVREEIWKTVQNMEKDGQISEDEKFRGKDQIQKVVDEYNKLIEDIQEKKEKEIMTV